MCKSAQNDISHLSHKGRLFGGKRDEVSALYAVRAYRFSQLCLLSPKSVSGNSCVGARDIPDTAPIDCRKSSGKTPSEPRGQPLFV